MKKHGVSIPAIGLSLILAGVLLAPSAASGQEASENDARIDLRPTVSEVVKIPVDLDPAEGLLEPPISPFYKNPWFWIAIVVTSCAAGVSIYMISQQDPNASLTLME